MTANDEAEALALDREDGAGSARDKFHLPAGRNGAPLVYFCGNSLGLQPKSAQAYVEAELEDWRRLGVHGHFQARTPWYSYHEVFRETGARLVGAKAGEVVMMNSLTTNLHLMMVTFYEPTPERHKIVVEDASFPSDQYAVESQLRHHGYDPRQGIIVARPRAGEDTVRTSDIEGLIQERGHEIALVMLSGVNYYTGQAFDMARITAAAQERGSKVGWDLAHAAGNLALRLHAWNADFAVWCSYKYLNAGPGAIGGCFVHERHGADRSLARFAGWWGNDPATRFQMHLNATFEPRAGADGWQLSNPSIFAMAPLRASLEIFDAAGMDALRARSVRLTGYLERLIDGIRGDRFKIITPRDPDARGCQLSIRVRDDARGVHAALEAAGVVCDFRPPNTIRVAPVPLYNTYHDCWRFAQVLAAQRAAS